MQLTKKRVCGRMRYQQTGTPGRCWAGSVHHTGQNGVQDLSPRTVLVASSTPGGNTCLVDRLPSARALSRGGCQPDSNHHPPKEKKKKKSSTASPKKYVAQEVPLHAPSLTELARVRSQDTEKETKQVRTDSGAAEVEQGRKPSGRGHRLGRGERGGRAGGAGGPIG